MVRNNMQFYLFYPFLSFFSFLAEKLFHVRKYAAVLRLIDEEEEEQWWGLLEVEVLHEGEVSFHVGKK